MTMNQSPAARHRTSRISTSRSEHDASIERISQGRTWRIAADVSFEVETGGYAVFRARSWFERNGCLRACEQRHSQRRREGERLPFNRPLWPFGRLPARAKAVVAFHLSGQVARMRVFPYDDDGRAGSSAQKTRVDVRPGNRKDSYQ